MPSAIDVGLPENTALVKISSAVASSDATIDFTGLDNTYSKYMIIIDQMSPANDGTNLFLRVGTGAGPTYDSSSNYAHSNLIYNTVDGVAGDANNSDTEIQCNGFTGLGNGAGEQYSAVFFIHDPSSATRRTMFTWSASLFDSAATANCINGGGIYKQDTAVTAIRFLISSGNISSGIFTLYGIK